MLNILIAEDDADDLLLFKEALAEVIPDFNVYEATNGVECMELLTPQSPLPDVIFLDMGMPLKNGLQCLKNIKEQRHLKDIPVIMLSTSDRMHDVDASYNNGATLYLVKPGSLKNLTIALKGAFHMLGRPKTELRIIENFVVKDSNYSKF